MRHIRCGMVRCNSKQISLSHHILVSILPSSQSIRNQESAVWPDHRDSGRKDLVQGDPSRRGLGQNDRSSVLGRDDVSHLEEYQEYMLRGKEYLGRLV